MVFIWLCLREWVEWHLGQTWSWSCSTSVHCPLTTVLTQSHQILTTVTVSEGTQNNSKCSVSVSCFILNKVRISCGEVFICLQSSPLTSPPPHHVISANLRSESFLVSRAEWGEGTGKQLADCYHQTSVSNQTLHWQHHLHQVCHVWCHVWWCYYVETTWLWEPAAWFTVIMHVDVHPRSYYQ